MAEAVNFPRLIRFGIFEVDLQSGELRKAGVKLKLTGQPFQVLAILLEHPGEIVAREELQKRLSGPDNTPAQPPSNQPPSDQNDSAK